MSAGILTLASNSNVVTGLDTKFTTELTAGDFIVVTTGGVTYTLPVKTIVSDTDLTLARNYNGPSASGLAWTAVPRDTLNRISAQIAADTAYIIRQRVLEVDNWYQLLEVNGDVTIKMADGSSYTGPSWLKLIDVMNTLGIDELIPLAEQIHTDAKQVANDKPIIIKAKDDALAAAVHAAASEGNAATSESNAAESASTASTAADEAAESARQAGASNPLLALQKSLNLSDLDDKDEAWLNVRPDGPMPLAADPESDGDSTTMRWVKTFIASVRSVVSSWSVVITDATSPANGTTVKGGAVRSSYKVGTTEQAAAELQASLTTSSTGVKTVSAEVVVKDSTSGTTVNKTIKLGTVDGLSGGAVTSPIGRSGISNASYDSLYNNNRNLGHWSEQMNAPGSGYLYPHMSLKLFTPGVNAGVFTLSGLTNTGGPQYVLSYTTEANTTPCMWRFDSATGNGIAANGSWVNGASDERAKYEIEELKDAYGALDGIKARTWRMNTKAGKGRFGIGVLANGLYDQFPEATLYAGDLEMDDGTTLKDALTVQAGDSGVTVAVLTAVMQDMVKRMADLEAKLKALTE